MTDRPSRSGASPLMVFYGICAAAGAVVPMSYIVRDMLETGEPFTPQAWLAAGFSSRLAASITTDFLIGGTPVIVWMNVEARRLRMRHRWGYVVTTFLVAFAFAVPLFLLMRERRLRILRPTGVTE